MPENQPNKCMEKNLSLVITGGSGFIGKHLTSFLLDAGYKVSHLSRNSNTSGKVRVFSWDPAKREIDSKVFEGTDIIIHLAGTNIGEKRWTGTRKEEIIESRVDSAIFLHNAVVENRIPLKAFISASATGIYGSLTSSKIFNENDPPATDFLGSVCRQWEEAADLFNNSGIRTVKIRTGVVLEKNDSALAKLMMPGKFGFLIQAGSGLQYMPWIHINDLCGIYLKAIEDIRIKGSYNAVAPQQITYSDFMKTLARVMKIWKVVIPIPAFIIRTVLGEMSDVILKGSRVSSEKILNSGYTFLYAKLEKALCNIIGG